MAECDDVCSSHESGDESVGDLRKFIAKFVTVLAKGNTFKYIIPSFPAYNAKIVEVRSCIGRRSVRMVAASSMFLMGLHNSVKIWITLIMCNKQCNDYAFMIKASAEQ